MEYLTKEEVVKIIKRLFENRHYISQPTKWCCILTGDPTKQRLYLDLYPSNATPNEGHLIIEFLAEHPDLQPPLGRIRRAVENSWDNFSGLSKLRRVDFKTDTLEENTE